MHKSLIQDTIDYLSKRPMDAKAQRLMKRWEGTINTHSLAPKVASEDMYEVGNAFIERAWAKGYQADVDMIYEAMISQAMEGK